MFKHQVLKEADLPEYVFRGTTYKWPGYDACTSKPYICPTTRNPLKAYFFAKECRNKGHEDAVIYVAKSKKLYSKNIAALKFPGTLPRIEEEIVWETKPSSLYKYSEGHVTVDDMNNALTRIGRHPNYNPVCYNDLSDACRDKASNMSAAEIKKLLKIIIPIIKYP